MQAASRELPWEWAAGPRPQKHSGVRTERQPRDTLWSVPPQKGRLRQDLCSGSLGALLKQLKPGLFRAAPVHGSKPYQVPALWECCTCTSTLPPRATPEVGTSVTLILKMRNRGGQRGQVLYLGWLRQGWEGNSQPACPSLSPCSPAKPSVSARRQALPLFLLCLWGPAQGNSSFPCPPEDMIHIYSLVWHY